MNRNHFRGESYDVSLEMSEIQAVVKEKKHEKKHKSSGNLAFHFFLLLTLQTFFSVKKSIIFISCLAYMYLEFVYVSKISFVQELPDACSNCWNLESFSGTLFKAP